MFNIVSLIKENKYLIEQLTINDFKQRYTGSLLGFLWSIINPLIMLVIYTFVFSVVFQAKWGNLINNKYDFAIMMFCGLTVYNFVSEVINRSITIIPSNSNYVKKVVFPLEIFPVVLANVATVNFLISMAILLIANFILKGSICVTLWQIILLFIPLVLMTLGLGYFVSAVSVYIKDLSNIINILMMIMLYTSPVFYALENIPKELQFVCLLNPLTLLIENMRNVLLYNVNINVIEYAISLCIAVILYCIGVYVFNRTKEGFADVL